MSEKLCRVFESKHEDGDTQIRVEELDKGGAMLTAETFWMDLGEPDASMSIQLSAKQLEALATWLNASRPEARQHEAWIVTSDTGKVLHFSRADGWELEIVQPHMNEGGK